MTAHEALVAATALHAGFQLVVTVLVYPALADTSPGDWPAVHERHSRRITPIVVLVYGAAAAACLWVLLTGPRDTGEWVALVATALAAGVTATVAGPAHARLGGSGPEPALVRRLLAADRVRLSAAVVALLAALV